MKSKIIKVGEMFVSDYQYDSNLNITGITLTSKKEEAINFDSLSEDGFIVDKLLYLCEGVLLLM